MRTVSKISFANENNTIEFYVSKALFLIYHQLEDLTLKIENKGCIMYKCLNLFKRASKWPKIIMHEAQQNYIYNLIFIRKTFYVNRRWQTYINVTATKLHQ